MKRAGCVAANAVLSGTVSEIGGGKFANGAVTGAFSIMFNDMMHQGQKKTRDISKKDLVFTGKNKKLVRKEAYEFMIERSKETGNEVAAAVLEDGNVIIFHDENNSPCYSKFYTTEDCHYVVINSVKVKVGTYIHTHPYYSSDPHNILGISTYDNQLAKKIGQDVKVLMVPDKKLWGVPTDQQYFRYEIPW